MTTITPPFTGSYGTTLQGINVTTYDRFGMSVAPKMGRSSQSKILLSSSAGVIDVTPTNNNFFDDSLKLPQRSTFLSAVGAMATGSISFSVAASVDDQIEITSTDGRIVVYTAKASRNFSLNQFDQTGTAAENIASLMTVITASQGHGSRLTVSGSGEDLYLSQSISGIAGNTTIDLVVGSPTNYTISGFSGGLGAQGAVSKTGAAYLAGTQQVITDNASRVIALPQYDLNRQTLGLEPLFTQQYPFVEMDEFNPVKYIKDPLSMAWPVVMENPSPIDPFDFNGAIEPLAIRKPIAGFSTFLGTDEDPEPTGIYGSVSSGMMQSVFYKKSSVASNFYIPNAPEHAPFEQIGAEEAYDETPPPAMTGSVIISFAGLPNSGEQIILSGTNSGQLSGSVVYVAGVSTDIPARTFDVSGTPTATATALESCIAAHQSGILLANAVDNLLIIHQIVGGFAGNTHISSSLTNTTGSAFQGGTGPYLPLSDYVKPLPYMTDLTSSISPYIDKTSQTAFSNISSGEIRRTMMKVFGTTEILGRPSLESRSAPCGWNYENTPLGIDSIAFGGLKK